MKKTSTRKSSRPTIPPKFDLRNRRVDLREIYEHGRQLIAKLSKPIEGSEHARITAESEAIQINEAEIRKRVMFAREYDKAELEALVKLERIRWTHVRKLLTVKDAAKRQRFAELANEHDWSVHSLACEIEGQIRNREYGGRRPDPRPLSPGSLHEFRQEAEQLLRLFNAFVPAGSGKSRLPAKERKRCQEKLPDVLAKLTERRDGVPGFMKKLKDACG